MIDEKKLIEEIEKIDLHGRMREYAGLCAAVDIIKNQPQVGEWIPCSERLPEDGTTVLVQDFKEYYEVSICETKNGVKGFSSGDWWTSAIIISHGNHYQDHTR